MSDGRYEQEEYLEQDDDERETAGRRKSLIALAVLAILVIGAVVLVDRLRRALLARRDRWAHRRPMERPA